MTQVMLRTDELTKTFTLHLQGGVRLPVLAAVGLELRAGECVVLAGPSGVGKSTLMRSLYGNYRAESGHILIRHRGEMVDLATADPRIVLAIRHAPAVRGRVEIVGRGVPAWRQRSGTGIAVRTSRTGRHL